jgi:hypothetical protein
MPNSIAAVECAVIGRDDDARDERERPKDQGEKEPSPKRSTFSVRYERGKGDENEDENKQK